MPLYAVIYTTYYIHLLSDNVWKGELKSMNIDREYTVFENDMDWRKRKRLQLLEEDDFRKAIFTVE